MKIKCIKNSGVFKVGDEFKSNEFYCLFNEIMNCIISLRIGDQNISADQLDNFVLIK
jgi:hypothetical protein